MKAFVDAAGRTWTIALTIDSVKRVRGLLGINLLEPEQGDPPVLTRLGTDVILLCDVVFALVKPQADALGVTDEQFGAALDGDAALAAQTAFYAELVDFFRQSKRMDRARMVSLQQQVIEMQVQRIETRIQRFDIEGELDRMLGGSPTSSPASSGSTPGP